MLESRYLTAYPSPAEHRNLYVSVPGTMIEYIPFALVRAVLTTDIGAVPVPAISSSTVAFGMAAP